MSLTDEYKNQALWRKWDIFLNLLPITKNDITLDLGCGIGSITRLLSEKAERVFGIDNNAELLSEAKNSNQTSNIEYIHSDLNDFKSLDLPLSDGIWSSFVAAYFPNLEPVLNSWLTLLRPGGWIALTEMSGLFDHEPLTAETKAIFKKYYQRQRDSNTYDFEMGSRLQAIISNLNLKIILEKEMDDPELNFSGPADSQILKAWADRFDRMHKFREYIGETRFLDIKADFLQSLQRIDHNSNTVVKFVLAVKP